jgi:hypothetical protein
LYRKLVNAIDHKKRAIGSGIKFNSKIISKERPSPPVNNATKKEALVPYHPLIKKIHVKPTKRKFLSLVLKYFNTIIIPRIIEITTNKRPNVPLTISKGSNGIILILLFLIICNTPL